MDSPNRPNTNNSSFNKAISIVLSHQESTWSQKLAPHWIEQAFQKRECAEFIPSERDPNKCGCGRVLSAHSAYAQQQGIARHLSERWTISKHTRPETTDAFGTIEFQGGPHPHKAQYVRVGFDSDPEQILKLFEDIWGIEPPKLVITVHGGIANFSLQPKLARVFKKGLLKAAKTTGAWIITSGINAGCVRHVAAALGDGGSIKSRSKIVTIGIAPWGLLKKREEFVGKDMTVSYHAQSFSPKGRFAVLNDKHSYFLLVDNGTIGRYGADIILRKRLEEYISKQTIEAAQKTAQRKRVPVVCVVLEGGTCTIRSVLDYVTNIPPVPVVVCDGSGRAADLLAFAHQSVQDDGSFPEGVKPQLSNLVQNVFGYDKTQAEKVIIELELCVKKKHLITVFRLGEDLQQDVDHAILTALLKGLDLQASDQLSLALAWNRVDIARSDIFVLGQDWPKGCLEMAIMEALICDRVEFVKLLLENGVSMEKFLTIERLEELYNTNKGPTNTLAYVVRDVVKMGGAYRYNLPDLGLAIEKLMGSAYTSSYRRSDFRTYYQKRKEAQTDIKELNPGLAERKLKVSTLTLNMGYGDESLQTKSWLDPWGYSPLMFRSTPQLHHCETLGEKIVQDLQDKMRRKAMSNKATPLFIRKPDSIFFDKQEEETTSQQQSVDPDFPYPFNDLLIWAVLMKRMEMARLMWHHGEEALAKSLVACKLYKSLAKEAADDYLEVEICDELRRYAEEFRKLAVELLEHCYEADDDMTFLLLTYELNNWGKQTCLSLAVMANHKEFLAHPSCQILLADLWHGGLRIRRNSNLKVLAGLLCPPYILCLDFKTKEELLLQPQTAEEHAEDIKDDDSGVSDVGSSDDEEQDGDDESLDNENSDVETGLHESRKSSISQLSSQKLKKKKKKSGAEPSKLSIFQRAQSRKDSKFGNAPRSASLEHDGILGSAATDDVPLAPVVKNPSVPVRKKSVLERSRQGRSMTPPPPNSNRDSSGYPSSRASYDGSKLGKVGLRQLGTQRLSNPSSGPGRYSYRDMRSANEPSRKGVSAIVGPGVLLGTATMRDREPLRGSLPTVTVPAGPSVYLRQPRYRSLALRRKFYEFYVAPITTFWFSSLSYLFFLLCFTYTVLVKTPPVPQWPEIIVIANVVSLGVDMMRKLFMSEPNGFIQKLRVFCQYHWNWTTMLGVLMFLLGFSLRMSPDEDIMAWGRVLYCCNICFWYLRLFDILSANSKLGPYITMVGKMVMQMYHIVTILTIVLMAFGILRQSILFPYEEWKWILVRNIFYKPYFMLYGEVYAGEIDTCGDEGTGCVPGGWITVAFMAAFLLVANILLISLLIAVFNNIYTDMSAVAHLLWKFQRYQQVMEYEAMPFLPPPLILLCDIYLLLKYCFWKRRGERKRWTFDYSLKLFLEEDDVEKVHDFEEECMDDLAKQKEFDSLASTEERIRRTADRSEFILMKLNDIASKETSAKSRLATMEERIETIHSEMNRNINVVLERQQKILDALTNLPQATAPSHKPLGPKTSPAHGMKHRNLQALELMVPDQTENPVITGNLLLGINSDLNSAASTPGCHPERLPSTAFGQVLQRASSLSPGNQRLKQRVKRASGGSGRKIPPRFPSVDVKKLQSSGPGLTPDNASASTSPSLASSTSRKRAIEEEIFVPDSPVERTWSMPVPIPEGKVLDDVNNEQPTPLKDSLVGLVSCPPVMSESPVQTLRQLSASPNPRFRRNDEYTSITDTIASQLARISEAGDSPCTPSATEISPDIFPQEPQSPMLLERRSSSSGPSSDIRTHGHDDGLMKRAKPSFVVRQNALLREFEETSSKIQLGLIEGRARKYSTSICFQSDEDLKEMGFTDLDIQSYIECLEKGRNSRSSSSSMDSLSSARLEDEEGFQQINECLMQQEEEKSRASSACISPKSFSDSPGPSNTAAGPQAAATPREIPTPTPTFNWSAMNTPLTSPGRKAGQIFTFDTEDLQAYLKQLQQDEKKESEDEE